MRFAFLAALAASVALAVPACNGEEEEEGGPTGSLCPDGSTLTYASFAEPFFATYCTGCHSSELSGPDRHGAPPDHNFDTPDGIRGAAEHIDAAAAAGPDGENDAMPPPTADDFPDHTERLQLGEWLACGAPE
jgi:uncharacterized membrane protein